MSDDLMNVYKEMLQEKSKRRDLTSSTVDVVTKSHPRSPIVLDFQFELFGLNPEDVKKLPIQSIEMLQKALVNLISKTKEDPMLRQALRRFINNAFTAVEKEEVDGKKAVKESVEEEADDMLEEQKLSYKEFVQQLTETAKAQKFNWKRLLDIDERKIQDPVFTSLLLTFGLEESLTRPQKQGVMLFIKKLAELASTNQQIALALTKLVRYENITVDEPVMESEVKKKSSELDSLMEGITTAELSFQLPKREDAISFNEYLKKIGIQKQIGLNNSTLAQYISVIEEITAKSDAKDIMTYITKELKLSDNTIVKNLKIAWDNKKQAKQNIETVKGESLEDKIIKKWNLTTDALKEKFATAIFKAAPNAVKGFEPNWKALQAIITQNKLKGLIEMIEDEKIKSSLKSIV